jgi:hypothetical protein
VREPVDFEGEIRLHDGELPPNRARAVRAALTTLFESFQLRRLSGEADDARLALIENGHRYVIEPVLRTQAVEGYEGQLKPVLRRTGLPLSRAAQEPDPTPLRSEGRTASPLRYEAPPTPPEQGALPCKSSSSTLSRARPRRG